MAIEIGNYDLKYEIKSGEDSGVYLAYRKGDKFTQYAVKVVKATEEEDYQMKNEIVVLQELEHQNIVKFIEFNEDAKLITPFTTISPVRYMVFEYLNGPNIATLLYFTYPLSEDLAKYYFVQLLNGLELLHEKDLSHRNINAENVVITTDAVLKILDFGLGKQEINKGQTFDGETEETKTDLLSAKNSEDYYNSQIYKGKYHYFQKDIQDAANLLYFMVTKAELLVDKKNCDIDDFWQSQKNNIVNADKSVDEFNQLSSDLKGLIYDLVKPQASYVPISDIYTHPWLENYEEAPSEDAIADLIKRDTEIYENNFNESTIEPNIDMSAEDIRKNGSITRSIGSETGTEFTELDRTPEKYNPGIKRYTRFFSKEKVKRLDDCLACFLSKMGMNLRYSPNTYSAEGVWLNDDEREVKVKGKILDAGDLNGVEVVKVSGKELDFLEFYEVMRDYFGGLANAKVPKETK